MTISLLAGKLYFAKLNLDVIMKHMKLPVLLVCIILCAVLVYQADWYLNRILSEVLYIYDFEVRPDAPIWGKVLWGICNIIISILGFPITWLWCIFGGQWTDLYWVDSIVGFLFRVINATFWGVVIVSIAFTIAKVRKKHRTRTTLLNGKEL